MDTVRSRKNQIWPMAKWEVSFIVYLFQKMLIPYDSDSIVIVKFQTKSYTNTNGQTNPVVKTLDDCLTLSHSRVNSAQNVNILLLIRK